jgi:hypothetical protein
MKTLPLALISLLSLPAAALAAEPPVVIVGGDGAFLGVISSDKYANNSFCNEYGTYGSPYSASSIFNEYGKYGSSWQDTGAYNPNATKPPVVVRQGKVIGIISKNIQLGGDERTDPDALRVYVCGK